MKNVTVEVTITGPRHSGKTKIGDYINDVIQEVQDELPDTEIRLVILEQDKYPPRQELFPSYNGIEL